MLFGYTLVEQVTFSPRCAMSRSSEFESFRGFWPGKHITPPNHEHHYHHSMTLVFVIQKSVVGGLLRTKKHVPVNGPPRSRTCRSRALDAAAPNSSIEVGNLYIKPLQPSRLRCLKRRSKPMTSRYSNTQEEGWASREAVLCENKLIVSRGGRSTMVYGFAICGRPS